MILEMSNRQLAMEAGAEGEVRNEILIWESYCIDGIPSHWAARREWAWLEMSMVQHSPVRDHEG